MAVNAGKQRQEVEADLGLAFVLGELKPRIRSEGLVDHLGALLSAAPPAALGSLEDRKQFLEGLVQWLRVDGKLSVHRIRVLVEALRALPSHAAAIGEAIAGLVAACDGVDLLAEAGFAAAQGFLPDASDRLLRKVIPRPREPHDLGAISGELFPSKRDADFIDALPAPLVGELAQLVGLRTAFAALRDPALDAMAVLAARTSAIGLSPDLRERSSGLSDDPFLKLARAVDVFSSATRAGRSTAAGTSVRAAAAQCRWAIAAAHERMDEEGVSVDRVWRLERAARLVDRLCALLAVLTIEGSTEPGRQLFASLVRERAADQSVRELCRQSLQTLTRKVVERNGESGDHYITTSRAGWHAMVSSAAGGGALTAFTVLVKMALYTASLPLFFEGLAASANYAVSFGLMHLLGFTLATKQPAMTAAALAQGLRRPGAALDAETVVDRISALTRSQLAAIVGNLTAVIPSVIALDLFTRAVRGTPFLDAATAEHALQSLHPLRSGTVPFAALTGVLLFLGSLGAGGFENWVVLRRIPEALAQSRRLNRLVGPARAAAIAGFVSRHAAGLGGSVALGLMLGGVPALSNVFGLGLQVRHVTLSTGTLALAASGLGTAHALSPAVFWAFGGVACMAVLNLSVSFALALLLALRSQGASGREQLNLARALLSRLRREPRSFLFPPRDLRAD